MNTHTRLPIAYQLAVLALLALVIALLFLWVSALSSKGAADGEAWSSCIAIHSVDYCNNRR